MATQITTRNPNNNKILKTYPPMNEAQINKILASSWNSFENWRLTSISDRVLGLRKLQNLLLAEKDSLASLIRDEMGKKKEEAVAEIEKCANCANYYAENATIFLSYKEIKTEAKKSYVSMEPIGPILAIMPWNFPFWQALRCAIPAILAGNTVILKHASNVSGCALAIEEIFSRAMPNTLRTILLSGEETQKLISRDEIAAVSFTGSTPVGRKVAALAGEALKKIILELGGSDPYIILEDADLERTAKICAESRLINSGQSCISAKRFIVMEPMQEKFALLLKVAMQNISIAPMARLDLREELHEQVLKSVACGAKIFLGGAIPAGEGNHYPATILTQVKQGMPAFEEELFGPVAAIIPAANQEDAIRLANATRFGLGAAIFTKNEELGEKIAREQLCAGSAFVNNFVRSDPRLPFGGIKDSGHGRELSQFGFQEFCNIKTIWISND